MTEKEAQEIRKTPMTVGVGSAFKSHKILDDKRLIGGYKTWSEYRKCADIYLEALKKAKILEKALEFYTLPAQLNIPLKTMGKAANEALAQWRKIK